MGAVRLGEQPMEFEPGTLQICRNLGAIDWVGGRRHTENDPPT
jgi:hypothetical protein